MTEQKTHPLTPSLYQRLMGSAWADLDEAMRQDHNAEARLWRGGLFRVQHGTSRLARLLAAALRLPSEADEVRTELVITPFERGEIWTRRFGAQTFVTEQSERACGVLSERISIVELRFRLEVREGALVYKSIGAAMCAGRLRIPLPALLTPRVEASEAAAGSGRTRVSLRVVLPIGGLLISYNGFTQKKEAQ